MYGKHLLFQEKKRLTFFWKNIWHDFFHLFCLISVQTGVYAQNKGKISPHVKLKISETRKYQEIIPMKFFVPTLFERFKYAFFHIFQLFLS